MEGVIVLSSDNDDEGNDNASGTVQEVSPSSAEHPEHADVKQKKAMRIQKLTDALNKLQQIIQRSEEVEVDFDDEDDSSYLRLEIYKERAIEIYEKLCELTGETAVKKLKFKGTDYVEFNKKLQRFVNERGQFPDLCKVLAIMDHCNTKYNYRMSPAMLKDVAQDAFVQIGNMLQKRRKRDLFEMVNYYASGNIDPASEDPTLKSKLDDNRRRYGKRIDEVINHFCRQQNVESGKGSEGSGSSSRNNAVETPTTSSIASEPTTSTIVLVQPSTEADVQQQSQPMEIDGNDIIILDDGDDDGQQLIDLTEE